MAAKQPISKPDSPPSNYDAGRGIIKGHESGVRVSYCRPCADDKWSAVIQQLDHANLAQLPEWLMAIRKAYGHTPIYLQAEDGNGRFGILPSFLVYRRLFGTVVTSMPFLDAGGPCSSSESLARVLVNSLIKEATRCGARLIELRCTVEMDLPVPPMRNKVSLVLPLTANSGSLWREFDPKVRNQIRKAERSGLSVELNGAEKLDDFYDVFAANMRELGSPVHSRGFFDAIFDAFRKKARVALVRKGPIVVGGLIALAFKDTLAVPWASSLREYFSLCPNMLLYWETIRSACTEGFQRFDFGRSSRNSGTYNFKRQWGALEKPLYWYTIPIHSNHVSRLSPVNGQGALLVRLWQHVPLSVTRWLGPHIRKYLTQ